MAKITKNNPKPTLTHMKSSEVSKPEAQEKSIAPEIEKKIELKVPEVEMKPKDTGVYVSNTSISNFRSKTKFFTKHKGQLKVITFQGGTIKSRDTEHNKELAFIASRFPKHVQKGTASNIPNPANGQKEAMRKAIRMHIPDKAMQKELSKLLQ